MSTSKIVIQDGSGNVYYPKTSIDSVIYSDNTSIEEKIRMLETKLNELKSRLVDSINDKTGSSLTSNSTIDEMAAIINSIKTLEQATADADAKASNILVDKTAYVNGTKITGTMPENGAVAQTLSANGTINLGSGHYDSIKITQYLNTRGVTIWKPSPHTQSIPAGTYLTGTQTIEGDKNLAPQNIRAGVSIFGIDGILTAQSLGGKQYKQGTVIDENDHITSYVGSNDITTRYVKITGYDFKANSGYIYTTDSNGKIKHKVIFINENYVIWLINGRKDFIGLTIYKNVYGELLLQSNFYGSPNYTDRLTWNYVIYE